MSTENASNSVESGSVRFILYFSIMDDFWYGWQDIADLYASPRILWYQKCSVIICFVASSSKWPGLPWKSESMYFLISNLCTSLTQEMFPMENFDPHRKELRQISPNNNLNSACRFLMYCDDKNPYTAKALALHHFPVIDIIELKLVPLLPGNTL